MMVRDMVRVVAYGGHARLAHLAEVLADPVEHDHRLVDRITEYRQYRGEHGQREIPLKEREETEDDDHVVQVGDDRRDAELPLEPEREIRDDAERGDEQRERAVLRQLPGHP